MNLQVGDVGGGCLIIDIEKATLQWLPALPLYLLEFLCGMCGAKVELRLGLGTTDLGSAPAEKEQPCSAGHRPQDLQSARSRSNATKVCF